MYKSSGDLPDLFQFNNGERVRTVADWQRRRAELRELILQFEYGHLPPQPAVVRSEELHHHVLARFGDARHVQYRIIVEGGERPFWFVLELMIPKREGKLPVVINGDGCWRYVTDEVTAEVLGRGYVLATFNRTEIVPDSYRTERDTALYLVYPQGDFGALAAWAWGYHRVVDSLLTLDYVEPSQIAIVGHSRGGKTVLLAGATDERIALTAPNDSGAGGAGCFRRQGPESETAADLMRAIPYWFSPRLAQFAGHEDQMPFDQHAVKALVAPRALLSTEALGDLWANPTGTYQTYLAAREIYRFLAAEQRIGIWYREGGHNHGLVDWQAFLNFADWQFRGVTPRERYDVNPFPDLPPAFSWSATTG